MTHPFTLTVSALWPYTVVFCRLAGMLLVLPGFSESFVMTRFRLMLALGVTILITPTFTVPFQGDIMLLLGELMVGAFIGMIMRIFFSALDIAGSIISFQMNLSSVLLEDIQDHTQTAIPSVFLRMAAACLIFQTDLHHLFLKGLVGSFQRLKPGHWLETSAMTPMIIEVTAQSFQTAIEIAAPFLIFSTALLATIGLVNRLISHVPIFFVSQPLQIMVGFFILLATIMLILRLFIEKAADVFSTFMIAP